VGHASKFADEDGSGTGGVRIAPTPAGVFVRDPDAVGSPRAAEVGLTPQDRMLRPDRSLGRAHTFRVPGSRPTPASAGPSDDFESFFRREHPRLLAIAVAMVGDREVARELVQDALLRAFTSWSKITRLESPGGWVRRVLINLSIDVHRRRGREHRALALSTSPATAEAPPLPAPALWSAVRGLPRLQRSVVALYYVDDMAVSEVAAVLGVSPGSVKTSLSRARTVLAPALSAHLPREVES
jgi:RNA polymerase sigma-70 factor (ECF subfamily)